MYPLLPQSSQLSWDERSIEQSRIKDLANAKDESEREEINEQAYLELTSIQDERVRAVSVELLTKAKGLRLSVPTFDEKAGDWERSLATGRWYLSPIGVAKVRSSIRDEEKWRMEKRKAWIAWVAALTGLIGATTGLIAVFKS